MGQEGEAAERRAVFTATMINDAVMAAAKSDAIVLHCLPAHREEEITAKVFEAHAEENLQRGRERLHAQKAVLVKLLGNR
jgi:ornithine carbamoyltransferase